jgi:type VI secretion system protein ImpJ
MRTLQPVIWAKGTFLTPQHLQTQDRFLEDLLRFRFESLNFRPWGFQSYRIDGVKLAAGEFVLSEAAGIFPDGLVFEVPGVDAAPPAKALAPYIRTEGEALNIYLAIPPHRESGVNVSTVQANADTRYVAEVVVMPDENTATTERPIQIGRKNFRLLVNAEMRDGNSSLQIARVVRSAAGVFELDQSYIPPVLHIGASEQLMTILRRLLEILAAKSAMLGGMRRQKNQTLADFTAADIANFWLLYAVNSHLPGLRHLFESRRTHPESLWSAMNELAGILTTFSTKLQARDLPIYDHTRLGPAFTELDEKLRMLIDTAVPANFVALPLQLAQTSIYATAMADEKYFRDTRLYLAVSADMPRDDLIRKTPQLIKVCSATHIDHLVRHALRGVDLLHTPSPPSAIPVKLKYEYFSLSQSGGAWEAIRRAHNLAAYVPADFPNPQLELLVLLPVEK